MFRLDGKSVLITGATGHLGTQLAMSMSELGAHVYVNSRNRFNCEALALLITSKGGTASAASFDVTNEEQIKDRQTIE